MSHEQTGTQYDLPAGRYTVEVSDGRTTVSKEVVVLLGKPRIVSINPAMTLAMFRGTLVGIALVAALFQFIFSNKIPPFLPFIPILLLLTPNNNQEFTISTSR